MRRSKDEILGLILELCKEPVNVTKIVYQCNLNFNTVKLHLRLLIDTGLLEVSGTDHPLYKTTEKGIEALKHINAFRPFLMSLESPQDQVCCP
jgi:predicted transcriptional regulator